MNFLDYLSKHSFPIALASIWGIFLILIAPGFLPSKNLLVFEQYEIQHRLAANKEYVKESLPNDRILQKREIFQVTPFVSVVEYFHFHKKDNIVSMRLGGEFVIFEYESILAVSIMLFIITGIALFVHRSTNLGF